MRKRASVIFNRHRRVTNELVSYLIREEYYANPEIVLTSNSVRCHKLIMFRCSWCVVSLILVLSSLFSFSNRKCVK